MNNKKIAIVYDWIDSWGGVERVLLQLAEAFPQVDFYTSYVDLHKARWAQRLNMYPSFIQKLPGFIKKNRLLSLPLFPYAFESFNLSQYDLVISVTSAFSKSVITQPGTRHICYLLTPPRYLWGMTGEYASTSGKVSYLKTMIASPLLYSLRQFDYIAAQRPDKILSISQAIRHRCLTYYHRDSDVLYPPFDLVYWKKIRESVENLSKPYTEDYYLLVSRLEPYKSVDIAIDLFNKTKKNLMIIGNGTQKRRLLQKAGTTIRFIEHQTDTELALWYMHAQALIMPQEEDFGYVALEAQLMGCPVVAYTKGGAQETLIANKTGFFFASQSEESLQEALERLSMSAYNGRQTLQEIEPFLETFSKVQFLKKFKTYISDNL